MHSFLRRLHRAPVQSYRKIRPPNSPMIPTPTLVPIISLPSSPLFPHASLLTPAPLPVLQVLKHFEHVVGVLGVETPKKGKSKDMRTHKFSQNLLYEQGIAQLDQTQKIGVLSTIDINESEGFLSMEGIKRVNIESRRKLQLSDLKPDHQIKQQDLVDLDMAEWTVFEDIKEARDEAYQMNLAELFQVFARLRTTVPVNMPELLFAMDDVKNLDILAGFLGLTSFYDRNELQSLLEIQNEKERLDKLLSMFKNYERAILEKYRDLEKQTQVPMHVSANKQQMEEIYRFLKNQQKMKGQSTYVAKLLEKLEKKSLPAYIKTKVVKELEQMEDMSEQHPEFNNKRNFLDLVLDLPFEEGTEDTFDLEKAKLILDKDHYGLNDVKQRILEFIAVCKLRGNINGRTMLLVGPPGVGKTSIAQSVADCLGRKFARISLGGESDTAIIKGHRRTYMGAYPGKIVQALKSLNSNNPVILIDEIDKISRGMRGSLHDALLEVLDPVQNHTFLDNYLDLPFDLSKVLFICTANTQETISLPLLDRLETIPLSGYLPHEKLQILSKHIIPQVLKNTGLPSLPLSDELSIFMIRNYSPQPGVRSLQKHVQRLCETLALEYIQKEEFNLDKQKLVQILGDYSTNKIYTDIGVSLGLGYSGLGGKVMMIETQKNEGKGLKITGSLGDVMKESVQIAYSFIQEFDQNCLENIDRLSDFEVHVHFPEGASKKDGPSAGCAIGVGLLSLMLNKKMDRFCAMTGELSLTGKVLPIGGVKEKWLAAKSEGVELVILPEGNRMDVEDMEQGVREGIEVLFVKEFKDIVQVLFPGVVKN